MNRTPRHAFAGWIALVLVLVVAAVAAATEDRPDLAAIWKIKDEGLNRSQVMETLSYLTDVHGPRLSGSSSIRKAQEWAQQRLKEWGLANVHAEPFEFGRGWELNRFAAHMLEPTYAPLIAYPKAWTPGTSGPVQGEAIRVEISSEADFARYKGKLKGMFVLTQPPRTVEPRFTPLAHRYSDEDLREIAQAPIPGGAPRFGPAQGRPGGPPGPGGRPGPGGPGGRGALQRIHEFYLSEGVAALIEPGRGDGGTVFVQGGGERGKDAPPVPPQVVMAVEHYNRICRILEKGLKVQLEIEIGAEFRDGDLSDHNVIAELPGTDKQDEIVMLGAHFDAWHTGTGATDNAAGCAVVMEALRILKAAGLQPRRTIRLALWSGEEQGLLGSRAYVSEHFASRPPGGPGAGRGGDGPRGPQRGPLTLKPGHAKLSAYFNLDNGTGKIRGIYLQGNEEVRPIFEAWLAPFRDMGVTTVTIRNTGGTDHQSFDSVGLPGFQFIQDAVEYSTRTHHSNMDVYDRIQSADLIQASVVMASLAYHTAMREEKLPRKPLPAPRARPESSPQAARVAP